MFLLAKLDREQNSIVKWSSIRASCALSVALAGYERQHFIKTIDHKIGIVSSRHVSVLSPVFWIWRERIRKWVRSVPLAPSAQHSWLARIGENRREFSFAHLRGGRRHWGLLSSFSFLPIVWVT